MKQTHHNYDRMSAMLWRLPFSVEVINTSLRPDILIKRHKRKAK